MKFDTKTKWIIFFSMATLALLFLYFFSRQALIPAPQQPSPTPIASGNIVITSPAANQAVGQQFHITGKARITGTLLTIRVIDKVTGKIYLKTSAPGNPQAPDKPAQFAYDAQLTADSSLKPGDHLLLEVFQVTKDGKEQDKIIIPLQFTPFLQ